MGDLKKFLPSRTVGVCAAYREGHIVAAVAQVDLANDDSLSLTFPKRNPFRVGDRLTVHLDDRAGSEIYSIELKVHRSSYKGTVVQVHERRLVLAMADYELVYGTRVLARGRAADYAHSFDARPEVPLPPSTLFQTVFADEKENANKLGVLITRAEGRPHTTVMAFLNSRDDDIFLITMRETFKYHNVIRNPDCVFAIDHRGTFNFEQQVDWNYTLFEATAHRVDPAGAAFRQIQAEFVAKNPWEEAFFTAPTIEMLHLVPKRIIFQDILCD